MKIARHCSYQRERNGLQGGANLAFFVNLAQRRTVSAWNWGADSQFRRAERAFTLTELIIASALLAVMVVSIYGGISFCFSNITLARQNLRATQIALEKMEIIRMYSWEEVNSNGYVPLNFTAPYYPSAGSDTNGGLMYYGTTIITNTPYTTPYAIDMREVLVSLTWTNRSVKQTLNMSTYISQYGMQNYIY